jgi:hypothetical protein
VVTRSSEQARVHRALDGITASIRRSARSPRRASVS